MLISLVTWTAAHTRSAVSRNENFETWMDPWLCSTLKTSTKLSLNTASHIPFTLMPLSWRQLSTVARRWHGWPEVSKCPGGAEESPSNGCPRTVHDGSAAAACKSVT